MDTDEMGLGGHEDEMGLGGHDDGVGWGGRGWGGDGAGWGETGRGGTGWGWAEVRCRRMGCVRMGSDAVEMGLDGDGMCFGEAAMC